MRELTDKQIIEIINKHRDFFLADIEENLCLEHYNFIHRQKLTEKRCAIQTISMLFL